MSVSEFNNTISTNSVSCISVALEYNWVSTASLVSHYQDKNEKLYKSKEYLTFPKVCYPSHVVCDSIFTCVKCVY